MLSCNCLNILVVLKAHQYQLASNNYTTCLQALSALLSDDNKFGFIIMDGNGALFGTLTGNTREVLQKFTVDLPKKHGKFYFSYFFFW